METDGIFVYGTLRQGGKHHTWLQRTHPIGACPARTKGRLFHLPMEGYPALIPTEQSGWVQGEFVGYEDEAELESALEDLDTLEGVDEGLFERRILPVSLEGGQEYMAWIYIFPEDRLPRLEREATELTTGDWSAYLK
jgi:gamma-glutamylcyclotransferase (GGCT)/AIG2-like uncharacterized protein YtfP